MSTKKDKSFGYIGEKGIGESTELVRLRSLAFNVAERKERSISCQVANLLCAFHPHFSCSNFLEACSLFTSEDVLSVPTGFKSVFVVSKTPCVISNGYRFW